VQECDGCFRRRDCECTGQFDVAEPEWECGACCEFGGCEPYRSGDGKWASRCGGGLGCFVIEHSDAMGDDEVSMEKRAE
jgi:hypothetical protein